MSLLWTDLAVVGRGLVAVLGMMLGPALPMHAAGLETYSLGDAILALPDDWTVTNQRRRVEVDLTGPKGESLMIYWWFPDEPLTGYDAAPPSETRVFPAGPALMRRDAMAGRSAVSAVFEWLNPDGERLIFMLESETEDLATVEAVLEPFLQNLRFVGMPVIPAVLATPPAAALSTAPDLNADDSHDSAGDFSFLKPKDWAIFASDLPGLRLVTLLPPTADAVIQIAFSSGAADRSADEVIQGQETLLYQEQIIPRQIDGESFDPLGGFAGHAVTLSARVYAIGGISLPYTKATAWIFRGVQADKAVLITVVHAVDAPDALRHALRQIAESLTLGPVGQTGAVAVADAPDPTAPALPDPRSTSAPFGFVQALAAFSPLYGGDCAEVDAATLPASSALAALALPVEAAAICAAQAVPLLAIRFPQDPTKGQTAQTGMVYMRAFLANGRKPIGLIDLAHGVLIALEPQGATGFSVTLHDLNVSPLGGASGLTPETLPSERVPVVAPGTPAAVLGEAPQQVVLFDGTAMGPYLQPFNTTRLAFAEMSRFDGGALLLSLPKDQKNAEIGLFAPEAMLWMDRFTKGASLRLRVEIDPAQTTGFQIALSVGVGDKASEPGKPRYLLHWRKTATGALRATHWLDADTGLTETAPPAMPEVVELDLTPAGLRVLAVGFVDTLLPWGELANGQGLRLYVTAKGDAPGQPASLALRKISLIRTPGPSEAAPQPQTGVEPLAAKSLFPGPDWQPYDLSGMDFAETAQFDASGTLIIEKPGKYERPRAGILSSNPVAELDDRLALTPFRLVLSLDPLRTDGFEVLLSNHKETDMWGDRGVLHLSLIRNQEGPTPDDWVLTLTQRYWYTWTRTLSAQDMAAWDGNLWLDLAPSTAIVSMPGLVSQRGATFTGLAKGAALYMTIHSASAIRYGPTRMALTGITAGWVTPDGMTARQRLTLQDTRDFDASAFLDLLSIEANGQ